MNGYECTFHHIFMGGAYVLVRALCNGKTSAFQADDAGSIPAARLFHSWSPVVSSLASSSTKLRLATDIVTSAFATGASGQSSGVG